MNEIFFSQEAINDLKGIQKLYEEELREAASARRAIAGIFQRVRGLAEYDALGSPLAPMVGYESSYRFLICGNYMVFYRPSAGIVYVDRVLFSRRDYIKIPFAGYEEPKS